MVSKLQLLLFIGFAPIIIILFLNNFTVSFDTSFFGSPAFVPFAIMWIMILAYVYHLIRSKNKDLIVSKAKDDSEDENDNNSEDEDDYGSEDKVSKVSMDSVKTKERHPMGDKTHD